MDSRHAQSGDARQAQSLSLRLSCGSRATTLKTATSLLVPDRVAIVACRGWAHANRQASSHDRDAFHHRAPKQARPSPLISPYGDGRLLNQSCASACPLSCQPRPPAPLLLLTIAIMSPHTSSLNSRTLPKRASHCDVVLWLY